MNLTPDTLYTVALNLSGKELLNMCSVNRETRRICMSEKFNPIWSKKLYEDYSIQYKGKDGYNKYLESTYFYHQKYWVATISYNREIIESALFRDRESGILFLVNKIKIKRDTVDNLISVFLILNSNSSYEGYNDHKYEIQETFFYNKPLEENYANKIENFTKLVSSIKRENFEKIRRQIEDAIQEEEKYNEVFKRILHEFNIDEGSSDADKILKGLSELFSVSKNEILEDVDSEEEEQINEEFNNDNEDFDLEDEEEYYSEEE